MKVLFLRITEYAHRWAVVGARRVYLRQGPELASNPLDGGAVRPMKARVLAFLVILSLSYL